MTAASISATLRQFIFERASERCEYCLYPQELSLLSFEIEHIISGKHGGESNIENLAFACPFCNRYKGTDLGSLDPETEDLTPFYNPRKQKWSEHFSLENALITPLTPEGRVTVNIFRLNHPDRILERQQAIEIKKYP